MSLPFFPEDAPFSPDQRAWLSGFMAGVKAARRDQVSAAASTRPRMPLHILYGSQTGNAETLAGQMATAARSVGFDPSVKGLDEIELDGFAALSHVVIITSTYGEGEMPDNAELFWHALSSTAAPRLEQMQFAILALGDTAYDDFCQAGKLFDTRLEQLGARRFATRLDCDIDFDEPATAWIADSLALIAPADGGGDEAEPAAAPSPAKSRWNRKNPYLSAIKVNRLLSRAGSGKEIRHFELDLAGSGLTYEAGDALAVIPRNDPELVDALIARLGVGPDTAVAGYDAPLAELFAANLEIAAPSRELVAAIAERSGDEELGHVLRHGDREAMAAWLWGKDSLDLLNLNPAVQLGVEEFVSFCRPLAARSYSISSSPLAHPDEVHLTIASVRHYGGGRQHKGVCSTFLADRVAEGMAAPVYATPNKAFRVPANPDAPMIMVGPGTGIAPFRAFLEERRETGAKGRNWLFFGDQHREQDFIYEDELLAMSQSGTLTRLDLAFSRDQAEKIYVQTRMRENGKELFAWLEEGGHFYVCGDASRMARDVDDALVTIVGQHGGLTPEAAADYVNLLRKEKRYVRDVY